MIFKVIAAAEIVIVFYMMIKKLTGEARQDKINYSYTQLDNILKERERTRQLEELITSSSAYKIGQREKPIKILFFDVDGTQHTYDTFVSDDALQYFRKESDKNHDSIMHKIKDIIRTF